MQKRDFLYIGSAFVITRIIGFLLGDKPFTLILIGVFMLGMYIGRSSRLLD